jgi:hypothetical protein
MFTGPTGSENPQWISNQDDEIRWGRVNSATCLPVALTTTPIGRVCVGFRRAQPPSSTSTRLMTQHSDGGTRLGLLAVTAR